MDSIQWLQRWYAAECDDAWEHQFGINIDTLDNPGWIVRIDLMGTSLQDVEMRTLGDSTSNHYGTNGDQSWLNCKVEDNQFVGAGGPLQLTRIAQIFREWAEAQGAAILL